MIQSVRDLVLSLLHLPRNQMLVHDALAVGAPLE
jgi:hypothetical protein